jgi:hypothetical protein
MFIKFLKCEVMNREFGTIFHVNSGRIHAGILGIHIGYWVFICPENTQKITVHNLKFPYKSGKLNKKSA